MEVKFGDTFCKSDVETEISDFAVTSSDPKVRKLARAFRIQRRLENTERVVSEKSKTNDVQTTLLQNQLDSSAQILSTLITEGDEIVTNVRVASDSREVDRREAESVGRQKVIEQLETEACLGQEMFDEITAKWANVLQCNDPIYIHEELAIQKERCKELVKQKDALISMLKDECKNAEVKFTNDQYKQNEDIKSLGQRLEKQIALMKKAYSDELKLVEDVILAERKIMSNTNDKKWESMYSAREKEELHQMNKLLEQMDHFQRSQDVIRLNREEKYRELKICIEGAIQNLEAVNVTLKVNAEMNKELLDYNYQVLRHINEENLMITAKQKRSINKLQDVISGLRKKIQNYDVDSNKKIANSSTDVEKLHARVIEMEQKAESLSKANDQRYKRIWDMNAQSSQDVLNKIMSIDKILHQQQLGVKWNPPESTILEISDLRSFVDAQQQIRRKQILSLEAKNAERAEKIKLKALEGTESYKNLLRIVLQQIVDQKDFLIEDRIQEILEPYLESEKSLVKIDNVFRALGLTKADDIDFLFQFFYRYAKCQICKKQWVLPKTKVVKAFEKVGKETKVSKRFPVPPKSETDSMIEITLSEILPGSEEEITLLTSSSSSTYTISTESVEEYVEVPGKKEEKLHSEATARYVCKFGHPLIVHPSKVTEVLRKFVMSFYTKKSGFVTLSTRLNQRFTTVSRLMSDNDVKMFWERYRDVFTTAKERLWDGLLFGLKQYHDILKDRKHLNDDVIKLRKENAKLKQLWSSYEMQKESPTNRCK